MTIAVPKNIDRLTIYDVSPFPRYIESGGEKESMSVKKNWLGVPTIKMENYSGGGPFLRA